jgi:hypothetical protein
LRRAVEDRKIKDQEIYYSIYSRKTEGITLW